MCVLQLYSLLQARPKYDLGLRLRHGLRDGYGYWEWVLLRLARPGLVTAGNGATGGVPLS